jgi:hypothetical protein
MRSVDKCEATFLKTSLDYELKTGEFENMSMTTDVTIKNRFGYLALDSIVNDDDLNRFLDYWVFPYSRKLTEGWTVVLSMIKKTVYDNNGQAIESESW